MSIFVLDKFEIGLAVVEEGAKDVVEFILGQKLPRMIHLMVVLKTLEDVLKLH